MQNFRHGDICFIQKKINTNRLKKIASKSFIVATGYSTGHTHTITGDFDIYEKGENQILVVNKEAIITHPEHKQLQFGVGIWEIIHESEYDYFSKATRKVLD